jgi:hypothetical protein
VENEDEVKRNKPLKEKRAIKLSFLSMSAYNRTPYLL